MIEIRSAEKTDASTFARICMEIWGGIDGQKIRSYFDKAISVFSNGYLIASIKNVIVGTGEGFLISKKLEIPQMNQVDDPIDLYDPNGLYYYIHGIEVLPDYRKKGIGSLLVEKFLDSARNLHCKESCGIALSDNIDFWLKQRFSIDSEFQQYKNFGEFAWVRMELES